MIGKPSSHQQILMTELEAIETGTKPRPGSPPAQRSSRRRSDSEVLPFGRLWYYGPNATGNAIEFAKFNSRSHDALIRVYDEAGNVIDRHAHAGGFKEWSTIHTSD